jgi:hypothetical protein
MFQRGQRIPPWTEMETGLRGQAMVQSRIGDLQWPISEVCLAKGPFPYEFDGLQGQLDSPRHSLEACISN